MDLLSNVTEYNWLYWIAGLFALFELFKWLYTANEWIFKSFGIETKAMREKRHTLDRISAVENAIDEIKETSKYNVNMFLDHEKQVVEKFTDIKMEIISEITGLHDKIDRQAEEIEKHNKANIKTDKAMLRDRIASGMRYFSQSRDKDGNVHIGLSDYENLNALFQEYLAKNGNGAFKKMYEDEFKHFTIDR